jgi:predicted MFS family arabinose efflux permease
MRETEFLKLWVGQTVSLVGSQFTLLALPLLAALVLQASPSDMGILNALQWLPGIMCGLIAGVVADRSSRRQLMLVADLARAAALLVPLAALMGWLTLSLVYAVAFMLSVGTVFFGAAAPALIPSLVKPDRLATAGSRMIASQSLAQTIGPSLGGAVIQTIGAPFALAIDAISFVLSAATLAFIRADAPADRSSANDVSVEVRHALKLISSDPVLRAIACASAMFNLFAIMRTTVYVLSVTRDLGFSPAEFGLVTAASGPSAVLAALATPALTTRVGEGPAILLGLTLVSVSFGSAPLAALERAHAFGVLVGGQLLLGIGLALGHVPFGVMVQTRVPNESLGRVWASLRVLFDCAIPVGALMGGMLGTTMGLGPTQTVATIGCLCTVALLSLSPVRSLRNRGRYQSMYVTGA